MNVSPIVNSPSTHTPNAFETGSYEIWRKYYGLLEKRRWSIDGDINWQQIDSGLVSFELQSLIYTASLIESFTFTTTPHFLLKHADKPWIIALQMARGYEECKHSHALWRYLECLDFAVSTDQLKTIQQEPDSSETMSLFERNVYAWVSEIETMCFYQALSEHLDEPVGKKLLLLISQDESVHGAFLFDTIKLELSLDPDRIHTLHRIIAEYQNPATESHYGAVVGERFQQARQWAEQVGAAAHISKQLTQKLASLAHTG